jgi:LPXTG-motif cell wall-anchored protein
MVLAATAATAAAQSDGARVRLIHAAPDTPPMDILVDGKVVAPNVSYATISDYVAVPAGAHTVAARPAGQASADAVITQDVTVDAGNAYTVASVGLENVSAKLFTDDLTPPAAGKARVRVLHFSPDAPGADIEVINGPTLVQNLAFGAASDYLSVDAGSYNLRLVANGANTVIVQLPNTTLKAGTIYDVAAVGRLAAIQVVTGTFTPTAGTTAATPNATPQATMPATGVEDYQAPLIGLALAILAGGLLIRRRTARRTRW